MPHSDIATSRATKDTAVLVGLDAAWDRNFVVLVSKDRSRLLQNVKVGFFYSATYSGNAATSRAVQS